MIAPKVNGISIEQGTNKLSVVGVYQFERLIKWTDA